MQIRTTQPIATSRNAVEDSAFWSRHFNQFNLLNISRKTYCREHDLNYDRFQYWYHKLKKADKVIQPIPVTVKPAEAETALCTLQIGDKHLMIHDRSLLPSILEWLL